MIKIESLKAGDVLYDVHSERAGNTTMRQEGCWECYVRAVDSEGKWVEISWNGNPARRFAAVPKGYKRAPKEWIRSQRSGQRRCHICCQTEDKGHSSDCEHPRAVAARKKAAKTSKEPRP